MKKTVLACAAIAILGSQGACGQGEVSPAVYSQDVLLKNWALSRCLSTVYADPATKADADATAAAYLEFGKQPIEAYETLDKLVTQYAARRYGGAADSQFNTMKCIDLYHSKELQVAVKKLLSRK